MRHRGHSSTNCNSEWQSVLHATGDLDDMHQKINGNGKLHENNWTHPVSNNNYF